MKQPLELDPVYNEEVSLTGPREEVEEIAGSSYPRQLSLSEDTKERLRTYIDSELTAFFSERQEQLSDWKAWQTLYWAKPEKKERNFPFKRSANIVVPLASIAVEAVHARLMNTLFSVEPFWSIRPRSEEWKEAAKPFEKFLQSEVESTDALDMYSFCNDAVLELVKLGTVVSKTGYERDIRKSLRTVGDTEEEFFAVVKNTGTVDRVPLANFVMRLGELDPQTAPMVGERHSVTWGQLKKYAQSGRMDPEAVEKIKHFWRDSQVSLDPGDGTEYEQHVQELAHSEPLWYSKFDFYELWMSFEVDGDDWDEEIVVDYHKESGTFLSVRYNWYDDLHRPYRYANYINVEGLWTGIGVCKQVEQFQAEVTTIHRQRLDNATLANMAQVVLRKGSGYGPGEPIFPGKMWFLDSIDDIREFKLSEVYPSSYANEQSVVSYYERSTGVNEAILGLPHEGTPATATSDIARLAEGNKRFDLVLKNIRKWLSRVGVDVITNYQLFGDQQVHWYILGQDGIFVEQVLRMPSALVRRGAIVDLTVTDTITNREVEKQQWLQLFQVLTNYYRSVFELSQIFQDPNMLAQIGQRALMGSDEAMRRLLETYTITGTDVFTLVEKNRNGPTESPGQEQGNVIPLATPQRFVGGGPA